MASKHRSSSSSGGGAREPPLHRGHEQHQQRSYGRRDATHTASTSNSNNRKAPTAPTQQSKSAQPMPPVQQKPFAWGAPKAAAPPATAPTQASPVPPASNASAAAPVAVSGVPPPVQPKPFAWGAPKMAPSPVAVVAAPTPAPVHAHAPVKAAAAAPPQAPMTAAAPSADPLITFGDFTVEETVSVLLQDGSEEPATASAAAPPPPMTKSWAEALGVVTPKDEPPAPPAPAWGGAMTATASSTTARTDAEPVPFEFALQEALRALDVTSPGKEMKKRGLVNQGNTCFQNVILQSLLACAPFLNVLVAISSAVAPTDALLSRPTSFKAWRHIVAFIREFEEPVLGQLSAKPEPSKIPKSIKISGYFLDVLSEFQKMRGEQEDALEFLEFFLDYLHSEYEASGLVLPPSCEAQTKRALTNSNPTIDTAGTGNSYDAFVDDEWAEVGKKGKSSVLRQNPVDTIRSPINWLFKGALRSELKQTGKKQSSITIEPFHCLHLNLEHESTTPVFVPGTNGMAKPPVTTYTINDMLQRAFAVEAIDGAYAGASMKRFTTMESLPVVLTLNIKRFTYHPELGPVKLQQFVQYPSRFEFPSQFLSPTCRAENSNSDALATPGGDSNSTRFSNPPVYELFAVVSHHGKFVVGGHYTCVCRDNKDQWFRFDDEHVASITEATALAENAYLLFYMRTNAPVATETASASTGVPGASVPGKKTSPKAKTSARPIPGMTAPTATGAKAAGAISASSSSTSLNVHAAAFTLPTTTTAAAAVSATASGPATAATAPGANKKSKKKTTKKHATSTTT